MLINSQKILNHLKGIIYEKTQRHEKSIDLTVNKVFNIENQGSLDFGGSEFTSSDLKEIFPKKETKAEKYGWWKLDQGSYMIEFNERITKTYCLIQPLSRLIKTACFIPMQIIENEEKIQTILIVGENGVKIKENARVAGLYQLE